MYVNGSCDISCIHLYIINYRYGTSTYMLHPDKVLHTAMLENDPVPIYAAVSSEQPPMVVTSAYNNPPEKTKAMFKNSGLWFVK